MYIKLKNAYVSPLGQLLHAMELNIKDSRMKTRFLKLLEEQENNILMPEKKLILETYCTKNEKGKPLMRDVQKGIYLFEDPDEEEKAIHALTDLLNECLIIELTESNKDMITTVANLLLNNDEIKVSGSIASMVDEWCTVFEEALEYYRNK